MNFSFTSSLNLTKINGINFNGASGFNMFVDSNTTNYITDFYNHRIIVFSKNWKYSKNNFNYTIKSHKFKNL